MEKRFKFTSQLKLDKICIIETDENNQYYKHIIRYFLYMIEKMGVKINRIKAPIEYNFEKHGILFISFYLIEIIGSLILSNSPFAKEIKNNGYIFLTIEPMVNMNRNPITWKAVWDGNCKAIITSQWKEAKSYFQILKEKDIDFYLFRQGFFHLELLSQHLFQPNEKNETICEYDVIMPGSLNYGSKDREDAFHEIKEKIPGIKIEGGFFWDYNQDVLVSKSKIYVYVPYNLKTFQHFCCQRILWMINKGICVIAITSSDAETEDFYKDLFISCKREELVDKIKEMLKDNKWKDFGQKSFEKYKKDFDGFNLFLKN